MTKDEAFMMRKLRKALQDLYNACWAAQCSNDLCDDIDGDLLDQAKQALDLELE